MYSFWGELFELGENQGQKIIIDIFGHQLRHPWTWKKQFLPSFHLFFGYTTIQLSTMISTENVQKCKNQFPVVLEISSLCNCRIFYRTIRLVYMLDVILILLLDFILVKIALPGYKYCKVKSADKKGSKISLLQMSKKF